MGSLLFFEKCITGIQTARYQNPEDSNLHRVTDVYEETSALKMGSLPFFEKCITVCQTARYQNLTSPTSVPTFLNPDISSIQYRHFSDTAWSYSTSTVVMSELVCGLERKQMPVRTRVI
jgi:hypothetical protein